MVRLMGWLSLGSWTLNLWPDTRWHDGLINDTNSSSWLAPFSFPWIDSLIINSCHWRNICCVARSFTWLGSFLGSFLFSPASARTCLYLRFMCARPRANPSAWSSEMAEGWLNGKACFLVIHCLDIHHLTTDWHVITWATVIAATGSPLTCLCVAIVFFAKHCLVINWHTTTLCLRLVRGILANLLLALAWHNSTTILNCIRNKVDGDIRLLPRCICLWVFGTRYCGFLPCWPEQFFVKSELGFELGLVDSW